MEYSLMFDMCNSFLVVLYNELAKARKKNIGEESISFIENRIEKVKKYWEEFKENYNYEDCN